MKAMLLALVVIVVVVGVFAYVVHRDPNRAQTRAAFAVLHEESSGVPKDPASLGYLDLKNQGRQEFDREFSVDQAMKETQSWIVQGTLLKQEYLLRQAEYKMAQLKRSGGDITSQEFEEKRLAHIDATRKFQAFWDASRPGN